MYIIIAVHLIQFTGPDNQEILLNPSEVVTTRSVRSTEHFGVKVKCLIHTTDGKYVAVIEDCETVRKKLEEE